MTATMLARKSNASTEISVHDLMNGINISGVNESTILEFFDKSLDAIHARGVRLSFTPIESLMEINQANRDSWRPLIPLFDAKHGIASENAFCLIGRNANGDVVATQAARFYDWSHTSFAEEAQSLRLFYSNPERSKSPGELCAVSSASGSAISGRVVFSGAGWYRRDYRKMWLSGLLPRISRALAYGRWNSKYTISIMAEAVIAGGMASRCGYSNIEYEVTLSKGPVGDVRCGLVWMQTEELLHDLSRFNAGIIEGQPLIQPLYPLTSPHRVVQFEC